MVTLSEYIGEIVNDIGKARNYADIGSANLSEKYYADPFIRALPIPHYTIDEAEIDVPVMVVGIKTRSGKFEKQKTEIIKVTEQKLPLLIVRAYKWNYIRERENLEKKAEVDTNLEETMQKETGASSPKKLIRKKNVSTEFSEDVLSYFTDSAKTLTEYMINHLTKYLSEYNYQFLKLLDLSEDFSKYLFNLIKHDNTKYPAESAPFFSEQNINNSCNYIGNIMFFEFKALMADNSGVLVEVATSNMNEYGEKNCLMRIKLKIKEQDLSLLVENANDKEKRFLSLT